jgi:hypothetical protein
MDKNMTAFLLRAKKATYAGNGAETTSSRPNSHDLQYEEGSLKYIDTYLGGECFSGAEAVWDNDIPIWGMNYVGRVVGDDFSGDFLKEALSHVTEDKPYRGPAFFYNDRSGYIYERVVEGESDFFTGFEIIKFKGSKVYECFFHGGDIK